MNEFLHEQKATGCLTLFGSCGWLPVLDADDGQADLALLVDVGVVDFCLEGDLRWFERILRREVELNPKCPFVIRRTVLGENRRESLFSSRPVD